MKPIMKLKLAADAAMTLALLLLMAYGLVGEAAHEWIGTGMFLLFLLHHFFNRSTPSEKFPRISLLPSFPKPEPKSKYRFPTAYIPARKVSSKHFSVASL